MKKYRLIKEYPNSPKLNEEFIWVEKYQKYTNSKGNGLLPEDIEKFPEFWEEIVEKDYEIMNFRSKKSQKIAIKVNEIGNYSFSPWDNILSEKELLEDDRSEIYSVRRLSDGEVFTIGDLIEKKVVIGKFKIGFDNTVWVETEPNYYDSIPLNSLSKQINDVQTGCIKNKPTKVMLDFTIDNINYKYFLPFNNIYSLFKNVDKIKELCDIYSKTLEQSLKERNISFTPINKYGKIIDIDSLSANDLKFLHSQNDLFIKMIYDEFDVI